MDKSAKLIEKGKKIHFRSWEMQVVFTLAWLK